jgi:hypothetical protein
MVTLARVLASICLLEIQKRGIKEVIIFKFIYNYTYTRGTVVFQYLYAMCYDQVK